MIEKDLAVLEQYEFLVRETYRGRGHYVCVTDQGKKLLQEYKGSEKRAQLQHQLLTQLREAGMETDVPVMNAEGVFVVKGRDDRRFIVKDLVEGRECDVYHREDVKQAVSNLAKVHKHLHYVKSEKLAEAEQKEELGIKHRKSQDNTDTFVQQVERRNAELKKVRAFIRSKKSKTEFEFYYLQYFEMFYGKGLAVGKMLEDSDYQQLWKHNYEMGQYIHGDYSQHNVLLSGGDIGTVNFEHYKQDITITDLAYFMRKILEKHDWEERLLYQMLEAYDQIAPITKAERHYLHCKLSYPEKFWKLTNRYYNANKAWASGHNASKLVKLVSQETQKEFVLKYL